MKDTENRRQEIIKKLEKENDPISGSVLAEIFDVSRQVIVQDIAILRAEGHIILSTNTGYYLKKKRITKLLKTRHTSENTINELNLIVDLGGVVEDVIIYHEVYGEIKVQLNIKSRLDVQKFVENLKKQKAIYLKNLTEDYHYHTVSADSEEILHEIEKELKKQGFLIK